MDNQPLTGQILDGYNIGRLIGGGAMGEVYEATHATLSESVAIKILRKEFASNENFRLRFEREIRLMKSLRHDNIIPIYHHGRAGDHLYFTMKLIQGPTLFNMMQHQYFSPISAWEILRPISEGLAYGHGMGIIHRDVKPSNIFVEYREGKLHVYLGDYGLGKAPDVDDTLTHFGVPIGTPEYMAPEAALGDKPDFRADIYSLCVVTYEMLLGRLPFRIDSHQPKVLAHVNFSPLAPSYFRSDFPRGLEQVIMRGLEKYKDNRHPSVMYFGNEYYRVLLELSEEERNTLYSVHAARFG